jgi:hypothetical protein
MILFVCHVEISQAMVPLDAFLIPLEKPSMSTGLQQVGFHNVSTYVEQIIEYRKEKKFTTNSF